MGAALYEPINVYKPLALDIGIVDGPFEYLTVGGIRLPLPFTTRMTVIRLTNDDLFLHSPIAFDEGLAAKIDALGRVRHLVSPNQFHYAHIGKWARFRAPRSAGHRRVCASERERGISTWISREISRNARLRNGARRSTRPLFRAASSKSSFSFTGGRGRLSSPTRS